MGTGHTVSDLLIEWISGQLKRVSSRPALLMMSGAQGIGKSTALKAVNHHFKGKIALLSLDDFYLTKAEREALAETTHPLFKTRGPPGTHDIPLLGDTIKALLSADPKTRTPIPRFDKRIDDRLPETQWGHFKGAPIAVLLEGWCIGALPDPGSIAEPPMNTVEEQDLSPIWRAFQSKYLSGDYGDLWFQADGFFHLLAPDFETVYEWRCQQEETTLGLGPGTLPPDRREWVRRFIQYYERVTRRMLSGYRHFGYSVRLDVNRKPQLDDGPRAPLIVFSDLDGTLLDHDTYSFAAAQPALNALKEVGAILVLASSKTAAEIAPLRAKIGFSHCPAIVENGSGLLEPETYQTDTVKSEYADLLEAINNVPEELRSYFKGFSDWNAQEVADKTGLSLDAANLAKRRQFSEPGLWQGSEHQCLKFVEALKKHGITARKGGRFMTLSFGATKADQMMEVLSRYRPAPTLALGDAPNDAEMIGAADYGVIVANSHGTSLPYLEGETSGRITRTEKEGPAGWNQAVLDLLASFQAE